MLGLGFTLGRYLALRFLQSIAIVFVTVFGLIYMLDLVELMRRAGDAPSATTGILARLALYRTPNVAEQVMPFAVLFGAIATFLNLSRRLELVIARASGVSAWQFVFPSLAVAIVMGIAAVTIYNPVAANLKQRADAVEARLFSRTAAANERGVWIRQRSIDGEAAIRADAALDGGVTLVAPVIFIYDPRGRFVERINADQATLQRGYWRLDNATVLTPGYQPQTAASYLLSTNLTADQVREALGGTEKVSFWHLPTIIARLDVAGLDTTRYRLRYQSLLARPLLLAAMVVVAASVSLRFFRFGGVAPMVLSGVLAGFMLYVATQIAEDFGAAGIMAPVTAAWLPAIMGALMGSLVLLHREDG